MFIGCFPGVSVIAASEFAVDHPSQLPGRFLDIAGKRRITLHAMHSVVDWFAFAVWEDGRLIRSLSLSPDSGILEDIGEPLPFEAPYWAEQQRVTSDPGEDAYPLPFHPLELGEEVLLARFGYQLEGSAAASVDPFSIPCCTSSARARGARRRRKRRPSPRPGGSSGDGAGRGARDAPAVRLKRLSRTARPGPSPRRPAPAPVRSARPPRRWGTRRCSSGE